MIRGMRLEDTYGWWYSRVDGHRLHSEAVEALRAGGVTVCTVLRHYLPLIYEAILFYSPHKWIRPELDLDNQYAQHVCNRDRTELVLPEHPKDRTARNLKIRVYGREHQAQIEAWFPIWVNQLLPLYLEGRVNDPARAVQRLMSALHLEPCPLPVVEEKTSTPDRVPTGASCSCVDFFGQVLQIVQGFQISNTDKKRILTGVCRVLDDFETGSVT